MWDSMKIRPPDDSQEPRRMRPWVDFVLFAVSTGATLGFAVWMMERFLEPHIEGWLRLVGN